MVEPIERPDGGFVPGPPDGTIPAATCFFRSHSQIERTAMTKMLLLIAASSLALASCGKPANENADNNAVVGADTNGAQAPLSGTVTDNTMAPADGSAAAITQSGGQQAGAAISAQDYVAQAAASDQYEIQSSEMVLKQTKNETVRSFARKMISDHTISSKKLIGVATTASLSVPGTGLRGTQQTNLAALRDAGTNMDQTYINQQRAAHAEAIALHQGVAENSAMPGSLSGFAKEVLPRIQEHARMLDSMNAAATRS